MADSELLARRRFAEEIAREAGAITLKYFNTDRLEVERKADDSPVTVADKAAERHLRERISAAFPDDALLGEEYGEQPGTSGYRWILDPIDGTKSFIAGVPLYTTLIGVTFEGRPMIGIIEAPALNERIAAARGHGAWHQVGEAEPKRAKVSSRDSLAAGIFCTSQVDTFTRRGAAHVFAELQEAAYVTRTWGDAYGYLLVATGRIEAMVDPMMSLWDAAALLPVLEEAGGTFSDWRGIARIDGGEGIGTNGRVLEEVTAITALAPPLDLPAPGSQ